MTRVSCLIPVLNRPQRVREVLDSIAQSEREASLHPLFLVNNDDQAEIHALIEAKAPYMVVGSMRKPGDYSIKINLGITYTDTDWIFAGADDLVFHYGWADEAIRVGEESGKRFVATNDQSNPLVIKGRHATHPLVHRSYIVELGTIDEKRKLYHENYGHMWIDAEATHTAISRDEFIAATRSIVKHMHPIYNRHVQMDDVYRIGMETQVADRELYTQRKHLWETSD